MKSINRYIVCIGLCVISYGHYSLAADLRRHDFPTLYWDYYNNKSILKLADPEDWRTGNSYKHFQHDIETAIINNSESTVRDNLTHVQALLLDPLNDRAKFSPDLLDSLSEYISKNHYVFMKECEWEYCPVLRTNTNSMRKDFEDNLVNRIKRQFPHKNKALRYIGFGAGFSLFSDIRVLLKLKMAGYTFDKIQFIDPQIAPHIDFIQQNVANSGAQSFPLAMDGQSLRDIFEDNPQHFGMIINTQILAQFIGILSNYEGDDVVEYYKNVYDYLSDNKNMSDHTVITSFDLISPKSQQQDLNELETLRKAHPRALVGLLYADFFSANPQDQIIVDKKSYKYTLISVCNECEGCQKINPAFSYCSTCKVKKTCYCSRDCQAKDWKAGHKKNFHSN